MDAAELETGLVAFASERCAAARVDVRWLGIDPARLPADGQAAWDGDPCRPQPVLSLWWTVPTGTVRYTVRPQLAVSVEAPVAARPVSAGEPVEVTRAIVPLASVTGAAWSGGPAVARRALAAGEPLTSLSVAPAPDLPSGAAVILRVRSGALEIRSSGKLLEDGRVGQPVRVWVAATDTSVRGVLSSRETVDL
jgi:flagella basal body P-ring formation protein FlgA